MSSYAVLWQGEDGRPRSGRLEFDRHGIWLHGGERGAECRLELRYEDILGVERGPCVRLGPCRAITILSRMGDLVLASLSGAGVLSEISDVLNEGRRRSA